MNFFDGSIPPGTLALLGICLAIALGFEFVNGFHDTANAVATVIYTKSLRPGVAVVWSGIMNLIGVLTGGTAVAFGIVHLLPVDLLLNIGQTAGLLMVLSLLLSAILWNIGTWYFGLPASSSHALIGSILGVGFASSLLSGNPGAGVNWDKAQQTGLSLLISPLLGFVAAGLLLLLMKAIVRNPKLYQEPDGDTPPPWWIRGILFLTCTGVSLSHGSNDGQKGIGLIMLILIGLLPAQYAVNPALTPERTIAVLSAVRDARTVLASFPDASETDARLAEAEERLKAGPPILSRSAEERKAVRASVLTADDALSRYVKKHGATLTESQRTVLKTANKAMQGVVDFVANWVVYAVALALGIGTTVGWKRIVVTVGEKIGKTHLTYAQGAAAELVAMCTILAADKLGLPVSTTHVLSSGVAGTMAANRSGLQTSTVRNIALAWVLTLPVTMLVSGTLFALTAGPMIRQSPPPPPVKRTRQAPLATQKAPSPVPPGREIVQNDWPRET
ncbi:MAG: inorganic phosphate transporter [Capsulimonadales bacterium]|nr:inorganic phosphate transporter [Capsulimonadales bacterium]